MNKILFAFIAAIVMPPLFVFVALMRAIGLWKPKKR
jgi:hypothetical protein